MARKRERTDVVVVGAAAHPLRDAYHSLLEMSWPAVLATIAAGVLVANVVFAFGYLATGGVEGARPGSLRDAFFFSVQTMGTVGYGAMYPTSTSANVLVTIESIAGIITTALATGIVFARFSRTTSEVLFSRRACIAPMDGVPTLHFRVGNDRATAIVEARVTVTCIRTERTREGVLMYRMYDLPLVRDRTQVLQRSFTVMHRIVEGSPLHEATPESCAEREVEIAVALVGTDDTSLQPVHARTRYGTKDIQWGARLADILSERDDGTIVLDVSKFHETVPTEPTEGFPYPRRAK